MILLTLSDVIVYEGIRLNAGEVELSGKISHKVVKQRLPIFSHKDKRRSETKNNCI